MSDIANTPAKGRAEMVQRESTRGGAHFTPKVDIVETEHELTLYAELPGVRADDVELHYENGELVLQGRVGPRHGRRNLLLQEYEEGNFYRVFTVHESIDARRIEAECKNGVLTVHLPKTEAVKPRQISVKGA